MTRRAWLGSALVHALLIAALAWCVERRPPVRRIQAPVELEVMELARAEAAAGSAEPSAPPSVARPAVAPRKAAPRSAAPTSAAPKAAPPAAVREPLAVEAEDRSGHGDGLGHGDGHALGHGLGNGHGHGNGNGHGHGLGLGLGGARDTGAVGTVSPPPPPRLSKARPPILLYPARDRPERSGSVFSADLTIDPDGYVTAVTLHPGGGARRDRDQAADAVWRFRYSPALDDDGHPTTARIEQRFMVE